MATTTTTNIKLVKPDYSEAADVQVLNGNADKIDAAFGETYNDLGIVVNGNKAVSGAAVGQFVVLKNSTISGRSDGLYTAEKAIPANTAIDSTYLTAVPGGGLNALRSSVFYKEHIYCAPSNNLTAGAYGYYMIPVTHAKGKNVISILITLIQMGRAGGFSLTGSYASTNDYMYVGYYSPRAISASDAAFYVDIVYAELPMTTNQHSETI